jgi:hypothetical protein
MSVSTCPCTEHVTRLMPSKSWNIQRRGGRDVGCPLWLGKVSCWRANWARIRRWATEETNNARVITIKSPWSRDGFVTNSDDTKNIGALRNRKPPSTALCPLEPAITSGSLRAESGRGGLAPNTPGVAAGAGSAREQAPRWRGCATGSL